MADKQLPDGYDDEADFIKEARERFTAAESYDRENRDAAIEDLEFLAGDQWNHEIKCAREKQGRPCLTINQLPQFVAQVAGDIRINRPAIKVRPAEDGDEDVAEVRQGLIRAIEQQSNAQMVYAQAGTNQASCGIGNFRLGLQYAGDETFDRDISISIIPDPLAVVWDPLSVEPTGRDARYCFVIDEMPRKDFEDKYPDSQPTSLDDSDAVRQGWFEKDTVRITEYWVVHEIPQTLYQLEDGSVVKDGKPPKGAKVVNKRETLRKSVRMYLINGVEILDGPYELPLQRVPIFRCEGWTLSVKGKKHRWGLVRFAKDPARLKNYWRSVVAETLALAPKAQWIAPHSAVDGLETDFRNAHKSGDPLLVFNDGATAPPQRVNPPPFPAALAQEALACTQDIKDVTGLHDASLGIQSNETSGVAINARDRQGDVATYIYPDNLKEAISECGRVINDLIPLVYDTARTVRILGDDEAPKIQRINDPMHPDSIDLNVGKYDVVVETGPSYSTKRVEAAQSMIAFVQAVPQAGQVAGDLIAKSQDWPMADQLAERLKMLLPPQLQGDPETPEEMQQRQQQMMQQSQQMQQVQAAHDVEMSMKKAQAAKAEAEAGWAQFQVAHLAGNIQQMAAQAAAEMLFGPGAGQPQNLSMQMPSMPSMPQMPQKLGPGSAPPGQPATPAGPALGQ